MYIFYNIIITLLLLTPRLSFATNAYYPLTVPNININKTIELTVYDSKRNREIPLLVYLPATHSPAPVILHSHGLGGSRYSNSYLGEHWAARGYVAVFIQHIGSDESVWKDTTPGFMRLTALKNAANLKNTLLRIQDVPAVLNQLEIWNSTNDSPLHNMLDMKHIGMSGHSYGALTTQLVSGQKPELSGKNFSDRRITASVIFSPVFPAEGRHPKKTFSAVTIPWMLMAGTLDKSIIKTDFKPEIRREVFKALPTGDKYELVLYRAEHSAFNDTALPSDKEPRNPNHHLAILARTYAAVAF